jgi:hypothetical protein
MAVITDKMVRCAVTARDLTKIYAKVERNN